jgi:ATP-dependent DNA helicase RecG
MQRLIQGEVGSGKTTVAAFALWIAARQGKQSVLICPTNILASQHFETLSRLFKDQHASTVSLGLYTSNKKDDADILVATHAIFQKKGYKPAVVIIDEEHRFGVEQRETFFKLKKKPHFLSMTATPIPRTVALTALADRDVSYIVPHKSNDNIKTWVVPTSKRKASYDWIRKTLDETGHQALVVCPFIEESFVENLSTIKSAKKEFDALKNVFKDFKLDLLHGKLKNEEKDQLFAKMMAGKTDILVTTPVVEVGVDIPKASIIIIEGAERYGLAQLHQLRGRVGRRGQTAYCLLFTTDNVEVGNRLQFFAKTYDGNALAEYDLKHRGSGELLGIRQHGFDALRFASWSDIQLIEKCKKELVRF